MAPAQKKSSASIFLVGFMATGKSSLGRLLAARLEQPFVDLDEVIAAEAGQSIASIFASEGEEGFRRREAAALDRAIAGPGAVVATGGGAPCYLGGIDRMRRRGLVVALTAPLDEVRRRAGSSPTRPLLAQSDDELAALLRQRMPFYRQAHACLDTTARSPGELLDAISALAAAAARLSTPELAGAVLVGLGERTYPVLIEDGLLARAGELVRRALSLGSAASEGSASAALLSDRNVFALYGAAVRGALERAGLEVAEAIVPAGESAKQLSHYGRLCEALVAAGLDRRSAIVALGGGVVGDLAGFVAATLYRGIALIHVPTTLLAMIDSAIGGKTGINLDAGKNLVGAFWQPALVAADPAVLATLPVRERRAALGELVKYALLDGADLYRHVQELAPALQSDQDLGGAGQLAAVIRRCGGIKACIVSRDEREQTGERALLNLGHTVGHAIEAATGYERFLHGEAVALGLIASCRISARLGLCDSSLEERVRGTLDAGGLDTDIDPWLTDAVLRHVGVDKKRTGSRLRLVALRDIGHPELVDIELAEVRRTLLRS